MNHSIRSLWDRHNGSEFYRRGFVKYNLAARALQIMDHRNIKVRESLLRNYFTDKKYLESAIGRRDLAAHLKLRVQRNREQVIPWIESFLTLSGSRILEIGCGTGSSTLALAERGARICAMDILPRSVHVARDRCLAYGYQVEFKIANAANLKRHFRSREFDAILYYAALEHMTHEERRSSLQAAWEMLKPGTFLVIIETPNRLWYFDAHTSQLPFYHWLPDRVAFEYSRFSNREFFKDIYLAHTAKSELHFLRRGRGVSFHEFELFIAPRQHLDIVSCLHAYLRARNPEIQKRWAESEASVYQAVLQHACPDLHPAFLEPFLDLAIRRD